MMVVLKRQRSYATIRIGGTDHALPRWARYLTIDADGDVDVHDTYPDRQFARRYWDVPPDARRMPLCEVAPPKAWWCEIYELER